MTIVVFGFLLLWQVTPLFFPRIPFGSRMRANLVGGAVRSAFALPAFPSLKLHSMSMPADPVTIIHKAQDLKGVSLYSNAKEYTAVFSGKVDCGNFSCQQVQLRLQLETTHNDTINKKVAIAEDGTYRLEVAFKETPQEHMDFTLAAANDQAQSPDVRGRRILTDETTVAVDSALHLD